jgi:cation:H+ antiporter
MPEGKGRKGKKSGNPKEHQLNRLSLLLTLTAVLFFTGTAWALSRDGRIDFSDGLVLVGLFLFWQCFHVFDVLKGNVRQGKALGWRVAMNLTLLGLGAYAIYLSTDWLVSWLSTIQSGFISVRHLGWLSGWLMVLPNGMLAFYYAWRGNPEVVYTSQVGDGHICIPLCIGVYALYHPIKVPDFFQTGVLLLFGAAVFHFVLVAIFGRLPRLMGWVLLLTYAIFVQRGLLH